MNNLLKNLAVPVFASRPLSALSCAIFGPGIPVFMVHRMTVEGQPNSGTSPAHLRRCLTYLLESGYTIVSLEEIILAIRNKSALPDKAVAFTMDDGYSEQGKIAAPIFLEFGCPITFFVISGLLDQSLWPWDAQVSWIIDNSKRDRLEITLDTEILPLELGNAENRRLARQTVRDFIKELDADVIPEVLNQIAVAAELSLPIPSPSSYQPLSWQTARELEAQGVRFAPHSVSHRILSKLSKESAEQEIRNSWRVLEQNLAKPLKVFCYPTGRVFDFGPREIEILKQEGFLGAVSTIPGIVDSSYKSPDAIFRLPRFELPDTMVDFIQCCSGIEHAKQAIGRSMSHG